LDGATSNTFTRSTLPPSKHQQWDPHNHIHIPLARTDAPTPTLAQTATPSHTHLACSATPAARSGSQNSPSSSLSSMSCSTPWYDSPRRKIALLFSSSISRACSATPDVRASTSLLLPACCYTRPTLPSLHPIVQLSSRGSEGCTATGSGTAEVSLGEPWLWLTQEGPRYPTLPARSTAAQTLRRTPSLHSRSRHSQSVHCHAPWHLAPSRSARLHTRFADEG